MRKVYDLDLLTQRSKPIHDEWGSFFGGVSVRSGSDCIRGEVIHRYRWPRDDSVICQGERWGGVIGVLERALSPGELGGPLLRNAVDSLAATNQNSLMLIMIVAGIVKSNSHLR